MRAVTRWRALSTRERQLTIRAALWCPIVETGLRMVSLPTLCRWLGIALTPPTSRGLAQTMAEIGRPEWQAARRVVRRWPARNACLREALVAGAMLRAHRPVLRIGVNPGSDTAFAHAWLEINGEPVGEQPTSFVPLRGARP